MSDSLTDEAEEEKQMADQFEFTDRYQVLGIPYPDPETMCTGPCEGVGVYPHYENGKWTASQRISLRKPPIASDKELKRWQVEHVKAGEHDCDGWHFIKCPDCEGTGKKNQ